MDLQASAKATEVWKWHDHHIQELYFSRTQLLQLAKQALELPHLTSLDSKLKGLLVAAWCQGDQDTAAECRLLQIQNVSEVSDQELTLSVRTEEGHVAISSRCCKSEPFLDGSSDSEDFGILREAQWFHEQGILPIQVDGALRSRACKLRSQLAGTWLLPQSSSAQQHIQTELDGKLAGQPRSHDQPATPACKAEEVPPQPTGQAPVIDGMSEAAEQTASVVPERQMLGVPALGVPQGVQGTYIGGSEEHKVGLEQESSHAEQGKQLHSTDVAVNHQLKQQPHVQQHPQQQQPQHKKHWQHHNQHQHQLQQQLQQEQPQHQHQQQHHNQQQEQQQQQQNLSKRRQRAKQFKQLLLKQSQSQIAGTAKVAAQQSGEKPSKRPKHVHRQPMQHHSTGDIQEHGSTKPFNNSKDTSSVAGDIQNSQPLQQRSAQAQLDVLLQRAQDQVEKQKQHNKVQASVDAQQAHHKQQQQHQHKQQGQKVHQQQGQSQKQHQNKQQQQHRKQQQQQLPPARQQQHGVVPASVSKPHLPHVLKRIAKKRQTQAQKSRMAALLAQYEPVTDTASTATALPPVLNHTYVSNAHLQGPPVAIVRHDPYNLHPYQQSLYNVYLQPQQYEPHVPPMPVQLRRSLNCGCFNAREFNQVAKVKFSYHFVIHDTDWPTLPPTTYDGCFVACLHVYPTDLKDLNRQVNTPPTVQWNPDPRNVKNHVGFEQLDGANIQLNRTANKEQLLPCVAGGHFLTYNGQVAVLTEVDNCGTKGLCGYTDALVATSRTQGSVLGSGEMIVPHPVHGKIACKLDLFTYTSPYVNSLYASIPPGAQVNVETQRALLALMRVKCIPPEQQ